MAVSFANVLIKVSLGKDECVREWLMGKVAPELANRFCVHPTSGKRRCALCGNGDPAKHKGKRLPCQEITILSIAYLMGPFDYSVTLATDDLSLVEDFIVKCLRSHHVSMHVVETQTMAGVLCHPNLEDPHCQGT